jgi:hypothetical protein
MKEDQAVTLAVPMRRMASAPSVLGGPSPGKPQVESHCRPGQGLLQEPKGRRRNLARGTQPAARDRAQTMEDRPRGPRPKQGYPQGPQSTPRGPRPHEGEIRNGLGSPNPPKIQACSLRCLKGLSKQGRPETGVKAMQNHKPDQEAGGRTADPPQPHGRGRPAAGTKGPQKETRARHPPQFLHPPRKDSRCHQST